MKVSKIALVLAFVLPVVVMASGNAHEDVTMSHSDFWFRVLNFGIFAGLLYYLIANPIKDYFKGRQDGIANQLKAIEAQLQASKDEAKAAEAQLAANEVRAKEIIADSMLEANILVQNIAKKNEEVLASLEKQYDEKMELESKKMAKEAIRKLLNDGIESNDIAIDNSKVVSLVSGKVA